MLMRGLLGAGSAPRRCAMASRRAQRWMHAPGMARDCSMQSGEVGLGAAEGGAKEPAEHVGIHVESLKGGPRAAFL